MTASTVCVLLSAAGLLIALLLAFRRRLAAATRWTAAALLPAGLWLTGLLPVGRRIGRAFGDWGAALVFDPKVWTGIALLALSPLLFATARSAAARRRSRTAAAPLVPAARAPGGATRQLPVSARGGLPAVTTAKPEPPPAQRPRRSTGEDQRSTREDLGDFSEIEEILRRRGI